MGIELIMAEDDDDLRTDEEMVLMNEESVMGRRRGGGLAQREAAAKRQKERDKREAAWQVNRWRGQIAKLTRSLKDLRSRRKKLKSKYKRLLRREDGKFSRAIIQTKNSIRATNKAINDYKRRYGV